MPDRPILAGGAQPVYVENASDIGGSSDPIEVVSIAQTVVVAQQTYTTVLTGELAGSATPTIVQMPTITCKLVKFKARDDNAGNVYIGGSAVTVANGATDTTTGFHLDAGEETGWIPVDNLNRFYRVCDNAGDDLTYLALV